MLVHRVTWLAKRGCRSQLREIGRQEVEEMDAPHAVRCLQHYGGDDDSVIWEFEFQDISEMEEYWNEWVEMRADAFYEQMNPLADRVSFEIYQLVN